MISKLLCCTLLEFSSMLSFKSHFIQKQQIFLKILLFFILYLDKEKRWKLACTIQAYVQLAQASH
jgi:hypothetical protein